MIDIVSVSLNAPNAGEYKRLCRPAHGVKAFEAVKSFIRRAVELGFEVTASVVKVPGIDLEKTKELAESLGAKFGARFYNIVG